MIDLRKSLELYHGEKKMEKYKREIKKQGGSVRRHKMHIVRILGDNKSNGGESIFKEGIQLKKDSNVQIL